MKTFLAQVSQEEGIGSIQQMGIETGFFMGSHFLEIMIFILLFTASVYFFRQRKNRSRDI